MPEPTRIPSPEPTPARPTPSRAWVRVATWLIPPIFACAAALIHFEFHVPRSPMVPRDKEDKKKKTKSRPPPAKGKVDKRKSWEPRELSELEQLRTRWSGTPILDEPEDKDFRRQHESLLRAVVQVARDAGQTDPTDRSAALRVTPHCYTIRCSIELCGPTKIVEQVATWLPKVERIDGPLWHEIGESEPVGEKPKSGAPTEDPNAEPRVCRAWVVGFVADGTKRNQLIIPGIEPKPPTMPVVPTAAPASRDSTLPTPAGAPPTGPGPGPATDTK